MAKKTNEPEYIQLPNSADVVEAALHTVVAMAAMTPVPAAAMRRSEAERFAELLLAKSSAQDIAQKLDVSLDRVAGVCVRLAANGGRFVDPWG